MALLASFANGLSIGSLFDLGKLASPIYILHIIQ